MRMPNASATILVVDDADRVRIMLTRMLYQAGYDVVEAADGSEALDRLRDPTMTIDLTLSDILMPRVTGTELARAVVRELPRHPIVLLSAYAPAGSALVGTDGLEVPVLQKPIDQERLLAVIGSALWEAGAAGRGCG